METYEYIIICLYAHACISWGLFAALMNAKVHPTATVQKNAFCFFINFIGMPIGITVAVLMVAGGKHDKYFIKP